MFCITCNADKHPVQTLREDSTGQNGAAFVDACPTCQSVFVRHGPGSAKSEAPSTQAPTAATAPRPAPQAPAPDALSLLEHLRARFAFCEEQIAARDGFITERELIKKMLAAADESTQTVTTIAGRVGVTKLN